MEDELFHYGVKGMHWGVHKSASRKPKAPKEPEEVRISQKPGHKVKAKGGRYQNAHEDAIRARTNRQKARKSTTDSLSDKELQQLVNRMNMEQQYRNLEQKNQSPIKAIASDFLKTEGSRAAKDIGRKKMQEGLRKAAAKKG